MTLTGEINPRMCDLNAQQIKNRYPRGSFTRTTRGAFYVQHLALRGACLIYEFAKYMFISTATMLEAYIERRPAVQGNVT